MIDVEDLRQRGRAADRAHHLVFNNTTVELQYRGHTFHLPSTIVDDFFFVLRCSDEELAKEIAAVLDQEIVMREDLREAGVQ